ncbi:MAG: murein biosynthesis integral membrane protein MurJ, partial [Verrucomicrobiota bacterium]
IFGEGAFNAAFVPLYSKKIEQEGEDAAGLFAGRVLSLMALLLSAIFAAAYFGMEWIVTEINPGFEGEKLQLAVEASKITSIYLVFICLVAAVSGILNTRKIFGAPAWAYVALNLLMIPILIFLVARSDEPVQTMSWGVIAAGAIQLLIVVGAAIKKGIDISPRLPVVNNDVKKITILMLPGLLSAGVQQVNLLVGTAVASLVSGGQAAMYYSDRINQLPLGVIGIAAGVVLLPEISRNLKANKLKEAKESLAFGTDMSLLLCIPCMVAMIVIPQEIIHGIFQGGKTSSSDTLESARALCAFALGCPAYVLTKVLQPGYFARENTRTPMIFTLISAVVNIVLVYPMFKAMGIMGCALATTIAGWVNFLLLWVGLRKTNFVKVTKTSISRWARMLLCAVLMGGVVWGLARLANRWIMLDANSVVDVNFAIRMATLLAVVVVGIIAYFGFIFATRVFSVREVKQILRRR